jgi:hypothetical protein
LAVVLIIEFFTADDPAAVDDTFTRFVDEFLLPLPSETSQIAARKVTMSVDATPPTPTHTTAPQQQLS